MINKNESHAILDKCKLILVGNTCTEKTSILSSYL